MGKRCAEILKQTVCENRRHFHSDAKADLIYIRCESLMIKRRCKSIFMFHEYTQWLKKSRGIINQYTPLLQKSEGSKVKASMAKL